MKLYIYILNIHIYIYYFDIYIYYYIYIYIYIDYYIYIYIYTIKYIYIYIEAGDTPQKWDMKNMNGIRTDTTNQLYDICICLKIRSTNKLQQF